MNINTFNVTEPLITVLLPVYNSENTIADCLKSILKQSFKDFNIYIYNDNSTDNTINVISSFLYDTRIKLFHSQENNGISYALNFLIEKVKTKYIARIDADDIMMPDRLEKQLNFIERNPQCSFISSKAILINNDNKILGITKGSPYFPTQNTFIPNKYILKNHIIHPTVFGKSSFFKKNPYDENYKRSEDHELWVRTYKSSSHVFMDDPLIFYRLSHISSKPFLESLKSEKKIIMKFSSNSYFGFIKLFNLVYINTKILSLSIIFSLPMKYYYSIRSLINHKKTDNSIYENILFNILKQ